MRENLKRVLCFALLLTIWAMTAGAQNRDPEAARIVTEDIDRFWEAFDKAGPELPAEPFQTLYLDRGTPGLEDFIKLRIGSAEELAKTVRKYPRYYASARESTRRIRTMEPAIRSYFRKMKELYPDAVFPDIYFVVGRLTTGGTTSDRALLIGAEMHGRTPQAPEDELSDWLRQVLVPVDRVPYIVIHELIHYQQKYSGSYVLLQQSIREGSADFLTELVTGSHINQHVHEFAEPREAELWREFKEKMHGTDLKGWLYTRQEGRPNDLGYWMGYKITKAYYDRTADKRQAVREILEIGDFDAFLAKSGYAAKLEQAAPAAPAPAPAQGSPASPSNRSGAAHKLERL